MSVKHNKELVQAVELIQAECKKHKGCETCPLRITIPDNLPASSYALISVSVGDRTCVTRTGVVPEDWLVDDLQEELTP